MKEDIVIQISNKLREVRKSKSITLQELAQKAGVTRSLLSQIENSRTLPSLLVLIKLIKALDLDLNVFFSDIDLNPRDDQVIVRLSHQYQLFEKEDAVGFGYRRILSTQLQSVHLDVVLLSLQPGAHRLPIATDAFELKYILEGTISYHIGSKEYCYRQVIPCFLMAANCMCQSI